jgi:TP901 family phage tail tape measure protein
MADIESNIRIDIDTSSALASIKSLQSQISAFQKQMASTSAASAANAQNLQRRLISDINATGQFSARMTTIKSTTESFTNALEKNKLSLGEYFRFAGASSKTFGRIFTSEFNTIEKVARERVKTLQTQYISMGRDANGSLKAISVRPLSLDMDSLATRTAIASQKQQLFNQLLKQGSTNLLNWGKNTQWAGRQLMVGFTIPLTIFGSIASKEFQKLEEQAIKFRRVYGDLFTTPAETDQALKDVRALADEFTKYGISVEQTVGLAASVAQMGNVGKDLAAQVREATRLSVLGGMDQQEALNTTISLTNAFGVSITDLTNKVNFLNAAENQTILSIGDFTEAIPKAGSVVKQLGGDVEDLALFLTAMREGGINASEAANALKSSLGRLINPTKVSQERMRAFGIDIMGIVNKNAGNLRNTVFELADELNKLNPLDRARAIEQLFGKFQFARMSTLFANITRDGSQAQKILDLMSLSAQDLGTIATRELGRVEESVATKFNKSIEQMQAALAPIGEAFLKIATPVIEFVTRVLKAFDGLSDNMKNFMVLIGTVLGVIAPVALMVVGLIANGIANILKFVAVVRNGFQNAGNSSKILGDQFSYMTQEQLEAAAVAASLDQTHSKLIQTFTSQAGAVNNLTTAYRRMLAAQQAAMTSAVPTVLGGRRQAPKKMQDGGIVVVPGSGKGDKVPAMLEPGEAVIPSKMTEKYSGLIRGMIADNIPGFKRGTERAGSGQSGTIGKSQFTLPMVASKNISKGVGSEDFGLIDPANKLNVMFAYAEETMQKYNLNLSKINEEVDNWRIQNSELIKKAVNSYREGATISEAFAEVNQKFINDIKKAGGETQEFLIASEQSYSEMAADLQEAQQIVEKYKLDLSKGTDTSKLREMLPDNVAAKLLATPTRMSAGEGGRSFQRLAKPRGALVSAFGGASEFEQTGVPNALLAAKGQAPEDMRKIALTQEHVNRTTQAEENLIKLKQQRLAKAAQEEQAILSKKEQAANKEISSANKSEKASDVKAKAASKADNAASQDLKTSQKKRVTADRLRDSQGRFIKGTASDQQAPIDEPGAIAAPVAETTDRLSKFNSGLQSGLFALTSLAGVGMMAGGVIGDISQKIFAVSGALFALMQIVQLVTKAEFLNFIQKRASAAAEALKTASTAGAIAATNGFSLSLVRASIAVSAFLGGWGLVIAGAIALGGILFALIQEHEKEKRRIAEMGAAARLTTSQLKDLGDAIGVAVRISRLQTDPDLGTAAATSAEEQSAIDRLRADEEGFLKKYGAIINDLKSSTQIQVEIKIDSLIRQLQAAGFDEKTIKEYIKAILQEAQRTDLEISFASVKIDTEQGRQAARDAANRSIEEYRKTLKENAPKEFDLRFGGWGQTGTIVAQTTDQLANIDKAAQLTAKSIVSQLEQLESAFDLGEIDYSVYEEQFNLIKQSIIDLGNEAGPILKALANPEILRFGSAIEGINDADVALQLLNARMLNINITEEKLSKIRAGTDPSATLEAIRLRDIELGQIRNLILLEEERRKKEKEQKELDAAEDLLNEDREKAINAIQDEITNIELQNKAYNDLISRGWSAADALAAVTNQNFMAAFAASVNKEEVDGLIDKYNKLREAITNSVVERSKGTTRQKEKEKTPLEKAIESLREQRTEIKNLNTSYAALRKAGLSVTDAMKMAESPIIAAAIATTKVGTKEWTQLLALIKQVNLQNKKLAFDNIFKTARASLQLNRQFAKLVPALTKMGFELSDINDLLSDPTVAQELINKFKDGEFTTKKIKEYLEDIKNIKKIQIQIELGTVEGMERAVNQAFSDIDFAFGVLTQRIELDFELGTNLSGGNVVNDEMRKILENLKSDPNLKISTTDFINTSELNAIISTARDQISKLNYEIDDLEALLQNVEEQEKQISEEYDKRIKALEETEKLNADIARQQQGQLDIASALARGDIAAAAKAAQQARAENAKRATEARRQRIERAREIKLAAVRAKDGRSREQIESAIKVLKEEIFEIEERIIEPIERALQISDLQKQNVIESLTYLDLNKMAWDELKNSIEMAKIESEAYQKSIRDSLALIDKLKEGYGPAAGAPAPEQAPTQAPVTQAANKNQARIDELNRLIQITRWRVRNDPTISESQKRYLMQVNENRINEIEKKLGGIANRTGVIEPTNRYLNPEALIGGGGGGGLNMLMMASGGMVAKRYGKGGKVGYYPMGGLIPYMASGGAFKSVNTDTVPAMLSPGEFVVRRFAVEKFGADNLKAINRGDFKSGSVYNYNLSVNVKSDANPEQIARTVMTEIKRVDSQRLRGNRF